ncbi:YihY/virulence factor BrkB family protein [Phytohalomonas tamaricis]|uniref:YihY/virulence factor BrkB family protein n=1 Tax=Phytohalomonas tamaricis TaxID=2081032 RepID=UPI000D0B29E7|nr:YihY/virulence factor BrkB family protein [Phytohalomonas tamaricis]
MATQTQHGNNRGRDAKKPTQIPAAGWRDTLLRVKNELDGDHVSLVAAGIAFYGLLAIFPAIAALISLWGLLFDPQQVEQQIAALSEVLPQEAAGIIEGQARQVSANTGTGMSLAAIGGLLFTIYSASKGVKSFVAGLNIIYDEGESRGFIKRTVLVMALTLGMIIITVLTLATIAILPIAISFLPLGDTISSLLLYVRWPILLLVVMTAISILYRYAPNRRAARWEWVSVGSVAATILWIIGSIGFSIYVRNFASYNETYGSLGAVVILLMWFWLSAYIVLLGAELNSEMERQTRQDTTVEPEKPMGKRGAYAADTVGDKP